MLLKGQKRFSDGRPGTDRGRFPSLDLIRTVEARASRERKIDDFDALLDSEHFLRLFVFGLLSPPTQSRALGRRF